MNTSMRVTFSRFQKLSLKTKCSDMADNELSKEVIFGLTDTKKKDDTSTFFFLL
jgi:hypothetical protein